jgi:hypothetical protein
MNDEWTELRDEYDTLLLRERELTPADLKRLHQIEEIIRQRWFEVSWNHEPAKMTDASCEREHEP